MVTIMSSPRVTVCLGILLAMSGGTLFAGDASAQDIAPKDSAENGGAGIRTGHIAATGRTMPNPGASQSVGTTSMDRGIQNEDKRVESSICKGC